MPADKYKAGPEAISIALIDGDPAVRHYRQLMLRSEKYDVRSYPTCTALLADPNSRNYACIILDLVMHEVGGLDVLKEMRASGWRGRALILNGLQPGSALLREAELFGDTVLPRDVGDRTLLMAITTAVDRGRAERNTAG